MENDKMSFWIKLRLWLMIKTSNPWVYRVYYDNGEHTYPLAKREAYSLISYYKGKVEIDWERAYFTCYGKHYGK